MLQYERIDISEGTTFNKSNKSVKCIICHYWYFKDIGFNYQPYVCNGCHDFSMIVQNLDDFVILRIKKVNYRSYIVGINKKDAVSLLNNSALDNKGVQIKDFGTNKTAFEIIKEDAYGGTYFRDIYSSVNDKFYKN